MTTPPHTTLTLHDGGDLAASVPHLLGFHPTDSLVVVTLTGPDDPAVGPVLRVDLPAPHEYPGLAAQLRGIVADHRADSAFLLVVCPGDPDSPPRHGLVDVVTAAFEADGVRVAHALWASALQLGRPWRCYRACGCAGSIRDPDASPIAAFMTVAGMVKYASRQTMADTLAPDPPAALGRIRRLIDALIAPDSPRPADGPDQPGADLALVEAAVDAFDPGGERPAQPDLDDERIADLAVALGRPEVRGAFLGHALTERARNADRLWTRLVRAVPAPERAEPACLLAISAYLRGDGAFAGMALDAALRADPGHVLAALLRASVDHAIPPAELRAILTRAAEADGRPR